MPEQQNELPREPHGVSATQETVLPSLPGRGLAAAHGSGDAAPRRRRRVSQPAPVGSDPHPFDPPAAPRATGENDDRLRADKPPHWG